MFYICVHAFLISVYQIDDYKDFTNSRKRWLNLCLNDALFFLVINRETIGFPEIIFNDMKKADFYLPAIVLDDSCK